MVEFRIRHSRESLTRLYRGVYTKRFRGLNAILWVLAVVFMAAMILIGHAPWYLVTGLVLALVGVVFLAMLSTNAVALALKALDQLGPELAYRMDETSLFEESRVGKMECHWRMFCGTREAEGHLLLERAPREAMVFVALPLEQLPVGARETIEAAVRQAGGATP
jgi:hypothetical protein